MRIFVSREAPSWRHPIQRVRWILRWRRWRKRRVPPKGFVVHCNEKGTQVVFEPGYVPMKNELVRFECSNSPTPYDDREDGGKIIRITSLPPGRTGPFGSGRKDFQGPDL